MESLDPEVSEASKIQNLSSHPQSGTQASKIQPDNANTPQQEAVTAIQTVETPNTAAKSKDKSEVVDASSDLAASELSRGLTEIPETVPIPMDHAKLNSEHKGAQNDEIPLAITEDIGTATPSDIDPAVENSVQNTELSQSPRLENLGAEKSIPLTPERPVAEAAAVTANYILSPGSPAISDAEPRHTSQTSLKSSKGSRFSLFKRKMTGSKPEIKDRSAESVNAQ